MRGQTSIHCIQIVSSHFFFSTRIYTFDSLGSKHPQAIRRLGKYLQMEAADKKGTTDTTAPTGTNARVSRQLACYWLDVTNQYSIIGA